MDIVEMQPYFLLFLSLVSAAVGWFTQSMWNDLKKLKEQHSDLRVEVNKDFVRKSDFSEHANKIENLLKEIRDELRGKVDKDDMR